MPEVSVIIVTLKERSEIDCLAYLKENTFQDFEVLIQREDGISAARNAGIRRAKADKIVFIDDDAIPCREYLTAATNALDDHEIVAGRIYHPNNDLIKYLCKHYDQGETSKPTDRVTGCNMAFRRSVFDKIGGFDPRFNWGHDETELIDRAVEADLDIWYEPGMEVQHEFASGIRDYFKKMYRLGQADVYYERKKGYSTLMHYLTLFDPTKYGYYNFPGTVLRSLGMIPRNLGKLQKLYSQQTAARIEEP